MQYTSLLVTLLAATGTLAAPASKRSGTSDIEVRLQAETFFLHVPMAGNTRQEKQIGERFDSVNWRSIQILADGAAKPRCKVVDPSGQDILATRGTNLDTTFSDGGKAEWTFDAPTGIKRLICDPAFEAENLNVNNFQASATATAATAATATASATPLFLV